MRPNFWKLSQGPQYFSYAEIIESIAHGLVYLHKDTGAKGTSATSQAEDFIAAPTGDYFYLTHGNQGMYLIGQFCGPANLFSKYGDGWLERPYKFIVPAVTAQRYEGPHKWWAPSDHSTFTRVAPGDLALFERTILKPHFDLDLARFGIDVQG
ncbi:hypothetical protein [Geopseudomonas guangdongensis]|uniref:Uncharacterized protein n=1 Tax=Geopseudomonas guangdongensis TaxID=1245526 RepID=A0A1H2F4V9_9GAMM|nr:hypothetical protein [Pseudomonas guangdongensis]MBP9956631.1 hypothetical protein [Pseudomonas sp.]SDU02394.1 hypothetical protein SAMN05216580_1021 [Pseudomonas guangdongensis]